MIFLQCLFVFLSPAFSGVSDSEMVAQSLIPLLEQTVQNLDRHRVRHLNGHLSAVELSYLSTQERTKFEAAAFRVFKENHIDGSRSVREFQRDPIIRDVRESFRDYLRKKISLEALIRTLIHERVTVEAFINDPELGYRAFGGFSRRSN